MSQPRPTASHFIRVDGKIAEPGATKQMIDAADHVLETVEKLPRVEALSALMNAVCIMICANQGEVASLMEAAHFGKELKRCISVNHTVFKNPQRQ